MYNHYSLLLDCCFGEFTALLSLGNYIIVVAVMQPTVADVRYN